VRRPRLSLPGSLLLPGTVSGERKSGRPSCLMSIHRSPRVSQSPLPQPWAADVSHSCALPGDNAGLSSEGWNSIGRRSTVSSCGSKSRVNGSSDAGSKVSSYSSFIGCGEMRVLWPSRSCSCDVAASYPSPLDPTAQRAPEIEASGRRRRIAAYVYCRRVTSSRGVICKDRL
jgi:hypothetical protein